MKKWIPAVLIMLLSTLSLKGFCDATGVPQDVFVTLTRSAYSANDLPFNAESVKPSEFEAYDSQNAGDGVSRLTSVSITPQGDLGTTRLAGIRGASTNQTLVLIDGRPVGGVGLSGSQDLSEIPTEQIDHIEIVRGGVSALYGPNAIGGVINVITKRATGATKPTVDFNYETGSFGRQAERLNMGARTGPMDYTFFGDQQTESGFRDNSDARTHNIGGNVGLAMGAAGKLTFDASSYHANTGIPGQLFTDIPPAQFNNTIEKQASTPDSRQITDTNYLRTSYMLPLPMNSLATLRVYGSQRREQFAIPSFSVDTDRHEQSRGGEGQFDLPLGLSVGGQYTYDRLDSNDFITPSNHYIAWVQDWGTFVQEDFHWNWLAVIPSVRYDKHSIAGNSTNPRVQVVADATDWLRFSASAARSFRAPTIDDLYTPFTDFGGGFSYVGNPNLRPERAWTYDAGFQVGQDSTTFRLGFFRANISDLIQTTPDAASTSINVGTARRQGVEAEVNNLGSLSFVDGLLALAPVPESAASRVKEILAPYVGESLNYTYLDNEGKPQGFTEFVPLRLSPRHTFNYVMSVIPVKGLKIDNSLRYVSSRWEGNDETNTQLDPYVLWGIRVAYQLRQLELYFGVDDLVDNRYEERGGYPLAGRTFYGGVNVKI